ncbi:hypothetical protein Tco_1554751 [Tanacetum coccineum]
MSLWCGSGSSETTTLEDDRGIGIQYLNKMPCVFHYAGTRFCDGTQFAQSASQRANQITNFSNSVGEARITWWFKLPASHVIRTVRPDYDENNNVSALLSGAYRLSKQPILKCQDIERVAEHKRIRLHNYGDESSIIPHGRAEEEDDHNWEGGC